MNLAVTNHSGQSFCLWSTKNHKYCYSFWFILSVWPFVWGWNYVNSFVSIPNILFNSLIKSATNYSPLSNTMLFSNPCNFHILSLNNLANPFTNIFFAVATKWAILDNLSQTTRIASFPVLWQLLVTKTNSNTSNKSLSRILSEDHKRTRQGIPAVLLPYLYYYMWSMLQLCFYYASYPKVHVSFMSAPYIHHVVAIWLTCSLTSLSRLF